MTEKAPIHISNRKQYHIPLIPHPARSPGETVQIYSAQRRQPTLAHCSVPNIYRLVISRAAPFTVVCIFVHAFSRLPIDFLSRLSGCSVCLPKEADNAVIDRY
jgi:hypothetical protein